MKANVNGRYKSVKENLKCYYSKEDECLRDKETGKHVILEFPNAEVMYVDGLIEQAVLCGKPLYSFYERDGADYLNINGITLKSTPDTIVFNPNSIADFEYRNRYVEEGILPTDEGKVEHIQLAPTEQRSRPHGYELNPAKRYIFTMTPDELAFQSRCINATHNIETPKGIRDYHIWLEKNGFSADAPNPTNEFVSKFYGVKPLWKSEYSQGIVIKEKTDDDYYILIEFSRKEYGYQHIRMLATPGGCM